MATGNAKLSGLIKELTSYRSSKTRLNLFRHRFMVQVHADLQNQMLAGPNRQCGCESTPGSLAGRSSGDGGELHAPLRGFDLNKNSIIQTFLWAGSTLMVHEFFKKYCIIKISNKYKGREKNIMNPHVPITHIAVLSTLSIPLSF